MKRLTEPLLLGEEGKDEIPILVADSSKEMKRSKHTSLHLIDTKISDRTFERHRTASMSSTVNEVETRLQNREKRNKWVKEKITRAFRQEKSPLTHYVYMRRRLYVARLCFALASATLFVSQNVLQFAKANGGEIGERVYESAVLFGSSLGAVYYGLRLDRKGWFTTTLCAASCLTTGTFLGLLFRIALSATHWGVSDFTFNIVYSSCLCVSGVLTGFGIGGFYPIAATLNTSLKRSCGEEATKGLDQSLAKTFTMQWVGRFIAIVVSSILYELLVKGMDEDNGIVSDKMKLTHDTIISVLLVLVMLYVLYHTFKLRKESGANYFIREEEDHLDTTSLDRKTIEHSLYRHRHVILGMALSWFVFDFMYVSGALSLSRIGKNKIKNTK